MPSTSRIAAIAELTAEVTAIALVYLAAAVLLIDVAQKAARPLL